MATLRQVSIAERLIGRIPQMNNRNRQGVKDIVAIRAEFNALTQIDRDAVLAVLAERGFDIAEYSAMLTAWAAVETAMDAQGIELKEVPQ